MKARDASASKNMYRTQSGTLFSGGIDDDDDDIDGDDDGRVDDHVDF